MLDRNDILKKLEPVRVALGVHTAVFGADGAVGSIAPLPEMCALCGGMRDGRACVDARYAGRISLQEGYAFMQQCRAGCVIMAAPLCTRERVWYALLGPVRMWDWDDYALDESFEGIRATSGRVDVAAPSCESRSHVSCAALRDAGAQLPQLDCAHARAAAALLMNTCVAAASGDDYLETQRMQSGQQSDVSAILHADKESGVGRRAYPLATELELLGKVRIGDRAGARAILNELLGHIFYSSGGNTELIKARSLELVIMISRAAVEGGAELNRLLGMNYVFVAELSGLSQFEDICLWLVRVLDKFMDTVYETRDKGNTYILRRAIALMEENFSSNLTLEAVAGGVHISPYYLSHLFRDELGVTFLEQLTRIRMERARQLLIETHMPVGEVAAAVGYEDAGYFAKLFKRYAGRSPGAFRKGSE